MSFTKYLQTQELALPGMKKNRYSVVAYYTRDLVYERLAPGPIA